MGTTFWSTLIGLVAGVIKDWVSISMASKRQFNDNMFRMANVTVRDRNKARAIRDPHVKNTRRNIAYLFIFSLVVAPIAWSFVYPIGTISIPTMQVMGGFLSLLPFIDTIEEIKYIEVKPLAILMPLMDMLGLIIGFYFGSGGTKSRV